MSSSPHLEVVRRQARRPRPAGWAVALLLAACGQRQAEEKPLPKPVVKVEVAAATELIPEIPIAGLLAPLPGRDVKVGALVGGRVDRLFVAEGDPVKVGQPLAHVEAEPLEHQVAEADARSATAKAALDNAVTRLARTEKLFKDGIASKQELDDAIAAKVAAESSLKEMRAAGGTAGLQLARATLRAPIGGVVAAILVPAGQPVDGQGTPVVEIADTRTLDLRAPVAAARAAEVELGETAALNVEGAGARTGTVAAIAPLVDPATNTVMVRIRVPNTDGRLRGGMFAKGVLRLRPRRGIAVPKRALLPADDGRTTRIAVLTSSQTLAHRELVLGAAASARVEVLEGLAPGDRVVVEGAYTLPEGTAVEVTE